MNIYVGTARTTPQDVQLTAQELGATCVYIDAAYTMSPYRQKRRSSRREYIVDIMEEIKEASILGNIPYVLTVQLNRMAPSSGRERRNRQTLDLSLLAESDAIGQIASGVIGIVSGDGVSQTRKLELLKNRDGPLGEFRSNFQMRPRVRLDEALSDRVASEEVDEEWVD